MRRFTLNLPFMMFPRDIAEIREFRLSGKHRAVLLCQAQANNLMFVVSPQIFCFLCSGLHTVLVIKPSKV